MAQPKFSDSFIFLPQGGIIQEFKVAGRNIVLGFPSAAPYESDSSPFFGENIGRVANRISNATIESLNGRSYPLIANNGRNSLHGGKRGWGKQIFDGPSPSHRNGRDAVGFKYLSKHGDEGFPGTVELRLWYFPELIDDHGVEKTSLEIEYEVELVGDEVDETVVSVTNHSYFNIGEKATIEDTLATLYTNIHQPVDADNIPTGQLTEFPGIQSGEEFVFGPDEPDIDHCFVINTDPADIPLDTRQQPMRKLCQFRNPSSRMHLEVLSTEPAFQLYTGKFIDVPAMDGMPARGPRSGLCVEASRYVNAVNEEKWRSMVVLKKGQIWGSRTIYRAWST